MLEKDIVNAIMRYLKSVPGCFAHKEHGGMYGTAGLPDIICCYRGMYVAFEVKTEKGRLTKLQEVMIRRIREARGEAHKVTSVEEVQHILSTLEVCDRENRVGVP
ncbi:VRR-NUC domain-containing protein [Eubacteriales bacterium OttesenSCG-928-A19]|nr:VRR-NUC domain-containing protein [Eubacteriales bacterium OttesenSCG-928-A19]